MLENIKKRLGSNYIEDTDDVLEDMISDLTNIASDCSNRKKEDELLVPYIKEAVISEYNQRGAEGLLSRNEGGISSSFSDIVKKLKNDLKNIRIVY